MSESLPERNFKSIALYCTTLILILFRTLPFLLFGRETLDGDEAIWGLMARDLAQGKAFPVFGYGTKYLLGVSAWLAAPFFKLFGPSFFMLRFPLLLLNLVTGLSLVFLVRRHGKLGSLATFVCCSWFLLPPLNVSQALMNANPGAIECFTFLLVLWALRAVPVVSGFISGIGITNRPFVLYGIASWLLVRWRTFKNHWKDLKFPGYSLVFVISATLGWGSIQWMARFSANYFGDASPGEIKRLRLMLEDIRNFIFDVFPKLVGIHSQKFTEPPIIFCKFPYVSRINPLGAVMALMGGSLLILLVRRVWKTRKYLWSEALSDRKHAFGFYLTFIGLLSAAGYVIAGPPSGDVRYTFQVLFGMVGLYLLSAQLGVKSRTAWLLMAFAIGCMANNTIALVGGWQSLMELDRKHPTQNLVDHLERSGIRAGFSNFWDSYTLTFLSNGRITIADALERSRIPDDNQFVLSQPLDTIVRITTQPCQEGKGQIVERWHLCNSPKDLHLMRNPDGSPRS
jgi:hypothetical protein